MRRAPKKLGEGSANLLEIASVLSVHVEYAIVWKKDNIDLQELASKRWVERWTVDRESPLILAGVERLSFGNLVSLRLILNLLRMAWPGPMSNRGSIVLWGLEKDPIEDGPD